MAMKINVSLRKRFQVMLSELFDARYDPEPCCLRMYRCLELLLLDLLVYRTMCWQWNLKDNDDVLVICKLWICHSVFGHNANANFTVSHNCSIKIPYTCPSGYLHAPVSMYFGITHWPSFMLLFHWRLIFQTSLWSHCKACLSNYSAHIIKMASPYSTKLARKGPNNAGRSIN